MIRLPPRLEQQLLLAEWEAQTTASVMDILLRVENSEGLAQGCAALVNDFQNLLGCRRVALGVCGKHPESFRLLGGLRHGDNRPAFGKRAGHRGGSGRGRFARGTNRLAAGRGASRHATLAHQKLSAQADAPVVISSPLRLSPDKTVAAWVFLGTKEFAEKPSNLRAASGERTARGGLPGTAPPIRVQPNTPLVSTPEPNVGGSC